MLSPTWASAFEIKPIVERVAAGVLDPLEGDIAHYQEAMPIEAVAIPAVTVPSPQSSEPSTPNGSLLFVDIRGVVTVGGPETHWWEGDSLWLAAPPDAVEALINLASLRRALGPWGSPEQFELATNGAGEFARFRDRPILDGSAPAAQSSDLFDPSRYSVGTTETFSLAERAMRIDVVQTPEPGLYGSRLDRPSGRLAVSFDGADTRGQSVQFNASWLSAIGIEDPIFQHESGEELPSELIDGSFTIRPTHFSMIFTFDRSSEGFRANQNEPFGSISWSDAEDRIRVASDNRDTYDEMFYRSITPVNIHSNFTLTARWRTDQQGVSQGMVPIFLAQASGNFHFDTCSAGTTKIPCAYAYYSSELPLQKPKLFLRFRDASGTVRLNESFEAQSLTEYRFVISYQGGYESKTLRMEIRDSSDALLKSALYTPSVAASFTFNAIGVATDGRSSPLAQTITTAWVDQITWSLAGPEYSLSARLVSARYYAGTIWDGSYAYVFGGTDGSTPSRDIIRYPPRSAATTTVALLPSALYGTSAVWDGRYAYIFGGLSSAGAFSDRIYRFSPSSGEVVELAIRLPSARAFTAAAWANGNAFIFGGWNGADVSGLVQFDPYSGTITAHPFGSAGGYGAATTDGVDLYYQWKSSVRRVDPNSKAVTGTWVINERLRAGAFWDGRSVHIVGGTSVAGDFTYASENVVTPSAGTATSVPLDAVYAASTISNGADAYVIGGRTTSGLTSINRLDLKARVASTVLAQASAGAAGASDGRFAYFFGGWERDTSTGALFASNRATRYDPVQDTRTAISSAPSSVAEGAAVYDGQRYFYVIGGHHFSGVSAAIRRYDSVTDTWTTMPTQLTQPRMALGAVWADGVIYIVGGKASSVGSPHQDILRYDPSAGTITQVRNGVASTLNHVGVMWRAPYLYICGAISLKFDTLSNAFVSSELADCNAPSAGSATDGESIYAAGGADPAFLDSVRGAEFTPLVLPTGRMLPAVAWIDPYLVVAGGENEAGLLSQIVRLTPRIPNQAPNACFTVAPAVGTVTTTFTVDASCSTDDRTPIAALSVRWDWTSNGVWDSAFTNSKSATVTYSSSGVKLVKVAVMDGHGKVSVATRSIIVNTPPIPCFTATPPVAPRNAPFTVDASCSTDDVTSTANLEVRWDWEASEVGPWDTEFSQAKIYTTSFPTRGQKLIMMRARDEFGAIADAFRTVIVDDLPIGCFGISSNVGTFQTVFSVDASCVTDDTTSNSNLEVRWDKNDDGIFESGWQASKAFSFSYATWGSYRVRLQVRDAYGLVGTASDLVTVTNLPPVLSLGTVYPPGGTDQTPIALRISYRDPEGKEPQSVRGVVGGTAYELTPTDSAPTATGRVYSRILQLPAGTHAYQFTASDDGGQGASTGTLGSMYVQPAVHLVNRGSAAGWDATGLWHLASEPNAYVDPFGGSGATWWYGSDTTGNYNTGNFNSGTLTSPLIAIPSPHSPVRLSYMSWYETEDTGKVHDSKRVEVRKIGGPWTEVDQVSGNRDYKRWFPRTVDLTPFAGGEVQIRFVFIANDVFANNFAGWLVDDIAIGYDTDRDLISDWAEDQVAWRIEGRDLGRQPIRDLRTTVATIQGVDIANAITAEVSVNATHTRWQDLEIILKPAGATPCHLWNQEPMPGQPQTIPVGDGRLVLNLFTTCGYSSATFAQHRTWDLAVADWEDGHTGALLSFTLTIHAQTGRGVHDSDSDHIPDGTELRTHSSSPVSRDIDADNLLDGSEAPDRHWIEDEPPKLAAYEPLAGDYRVGLQFGVAENSGSFQTPRVWIRKLDGSREEAVVQAESATRTWRTLPPSSGTVSGYTVRLADNSGNRAEYHLNLTRVAGVPQNSLGTGAASFLQADASGLYSTRAHMAAFPILVGGSLLRWAIAAIGALASAALLSEISQTGTPVVHEAPTDSNSAFMLSIRIGGSAAGAYAVETLLLEGNAGSGWVRIRDEHPGLTPESLKAYLESVTVENMRVIESGVGYVHVLIREATRFYVVRLVHGTIVDIDRHDVAAGQWPAYDVVSDFDANKLLQYFLYFLAAYGGSDYWRQQAPHFVVDWYGDDERQPITDCHDIIVQQTVTDFGNSDDDLYGVALRSEPLILGCKFTYLPDAYESAVGERAFERAWALYAMNRAQGGSLAGSFVNQAPWYWGNQTAACDRDTRRGCQLAPPTPALQNLDPRILEFSWANSQRDGAAAVGRTFEFCEQSGTGVPIRDAARLTHHASAAYSSFVAVGLDTKSLGCGPFSFVDYYRVDVELARSPMQFPA